MQFPSILWAEYIVLFNYLLFQLYMFQFATIVPPSDDFSIKVQNSELNMQAKIQVDNEKKYANKLFISSTEFVHSLSSTKLSVLESELESCLQLNELEPGNKCECNCKTFGLR